MVVNLRMNNPEILNVHYPNGLTIIEGTENIDLLLDMISLSDEQLEQLSCCDGSSITADISDCDFDEYIRMIADEL